MVLRPAQDSAELAAVLVEMVSMAADSRRGRSQPEEEMKRRAGRSWHRSADPVRWVRHKLGRREGVPVPLYHSSPLNMEYCLRLFFVFIVAQQRIFHGTT